MGGGSERLLGSDALIGSVPPTRILQRRLEVIDERVRPSHVGKRLAQRRIGEGRHAVGVWDLSDPERKSRNGSSAYGFVYQNSEPGHGGIQIRLLILRVVDKGLDDSTALGRGICVPILHGAQRIELEIAGHVENYTPITAYPLFCSKI